MSLSGSSDCLFNESNVVERKTEERIQYDHRIDCFIFLIYVILLILSILTIWAFKRRRFTFLHETTLSLIYGVLVGIVLRYGITPTPLTVEHYLLPHLNNDTCGGRLPPEKMIVELPVRDHENKYTLRMLFQYNFQQQSNSDILLNNKATFDPEFFFNVLLPPIIFFAGYSMKRHHFFKNIGPIFIYAFGGTLISALVVASICYGLTRWISYINKDLSFSDCILFGAITAATDPVTILSIFSDLKVDENLYALVFGESVLNDALAIALSQSVESYRSSTIGEFSWNQLLFSALQFFIMVGGSFLIGALVGCITALLTKFTQIKDYPLLETAMFVLMSYSTFLIAETVGFTGIVALLFCGVTQAHYTYNNLSEASQLWTKQIFELLNFLSENFLFAYIGVSALTYHKHYWDIRFIAITLVACIAARAMSVYPLSGLINFCQTYKCPCKRKRINSSTFNLLVNNETSTTSFGALSSVINPTPVFQVNNSHTKRIPFNFQHMLMFSGLRGAMAFSLAIRNTSSPIRRMFFSSILILVVLTVVLGGCLSAFMAHFLHIGRSDDHNALKEDDDYEVNNSGVNEQQQNGNCCSNGWYIVDCRYLKPLLTNAVPPLSETLPHCLRRVGKFLTTSEQYRNMLNREQNDNHFVGISSESKLDKQIEEVINLDPSITGSDTNFKVNSVTQYFENT